MDHPELADILILGFVIDLESNIEIIRKCKKYNSDLKVLVISEEPLWDTLWSGNFWDKKQSRVISGTEVKFVYLNHHNSDIFNYTNVPYFITTSNDFLVRYQFLFHRNALLTKSQIETVWKTASYEAAFYAEYRKGDKFNVAYPQYNIYGLCDMRTRIAENFSGQSILKIGKGWQENKERQSLADWHLDKLAKLDQECRFISAIENTHQENYITEKVFDALACLAIPIVCFQERSNFQKCFFDSDCSQNVSFDFLINIKLPFENIQEYSWHTEDINIDAYREVQCSLATKFSDTGNLINEKKRVVNAVNKNLEENLYE